MFEVLMYLFETYMQTEKEMRVDSEVLTKDLTRIGFHRDDVYRALNWLEKLANLQDSIKVPYLTGADPTAFRIYTEFEQYRLDAECRGLLLYLEQIKILNPETREMIIDRAMELETEEFSLTDLHWVILMVLFNVPGHEEACDQLQALFFSADNQIEVGCDS